MKFKWIGTFLHLMYLGHLATLFCLKTFPHNRKLCWKQLLAYTFLSDILMGILLILQLESYSWDASLVSVQYSHSFLTSIGISLFLFLVLSLFKYNLRESFMYAMQPLVHYLLDLFAFPKLYLLANANSTITGLYLYNVFDSVYFGLALEIVITLIFFFWYRVNNPHESNPAIEGKLVGFKANKPKLNRNDWILFVCMLLSGGLIYFRAFF